MRDQGNMSLKLRKKKKTSRLEEKKLSHNEELRDGINSAIQRRIDEGTFVFLKDLIKERPQLANHKLCFSPINFSIKTSSERYKSFYRYFGLN